MYIDIETTHSCTILAKYRSAEGIDGLYYDWYTISDYFRGDLESAQSAASITFVALAESGGLDEVTASEHAELFAPWAYPVAYTVGQLRRHNGKYWTSNVDSNVWEPGVYGWTEATE